MKSLKLLLISDIHCIGRSRFAFSRLAGDAKSCEQVEIDLSATLDSFKDVADFVFISGDFTENGKPHQYEPVVNIMKNYDPEWFCIIPGNHDVANFNTAESWNARMRRFKQTMRPWLPGFPGLEGSKNYFPYVRDLDEGFSLIGVDSTLAKTAQGRMGERQLELLDAFLAEDSGTHKIVLMHHDTTSDAKLFNGFEIHYGNILLDAEEFLALIRKHADPSQRNITVICGHTHNKRINTDAVPGATFITVPSFGSRFEDDYIALELNSDGSFSEFGDAPASGMTRKLKKMGKVFFPRIHT